MNSTFKAIWEGKLSLKNIKWGEVSLPEFVLPIKLNVKRKRMWLNHLKDNPEDYDGRLLYLYNFQIENNKLILNLGSIQFSTVIFMIKHKIPTNIGIGMMGVQCLIYSPCNHYILIGKRSSTQAYYPGAYTIPGGMLEENDLKREPYQALMREIYEEVPISLQNENYLISILIGWNNVSTTFLLNAKVNESYEFDPTEIIYSDKKEWQDNLKWLPLEELKTLNSDQLLDGLLYFKSILSY